MVQLQEYNQPTQQVQWACKETERHMFQCNEQQSDSEKQYDTRQAYGWLLHTEHNL